VIVWHHVAINKKEFMHYTAVRDISAKEPFGNWHRNLELNLAQRNIMRLSSTVIGLRNTAHQTRLYWIQSGGHEKSARKIKSGKTGGTK